MTNTNERDGRLVSRRNYLVGAAAVAGAGIAGVSLPALAQNEATTFTVRLENVSDSSNTTLDPSGDVSGVPVVLSPGAWATHRNGEPIFSSGEPERNNGLEEIAEDGMPTRLVASLMDESVVHDAGAFTTPDGADGPGPLGPGHYYEFDVTTARPFQNLSLVTMFVQSNDLFYALGGAGGFDLFDGSDPVSGDVTDAVGLWDAGTEINEEPGAGENQAPRQPGAGVGLVERGTVAHIDDVNGYDYPTVADVLRVTITPHTMM
jgi:hypothetical protein